MKRDGISQAPIRPMPPRSCSTRSAARSSWSVPDGVITFANADAEDFFRSSASVLARKHAGPFRAVRQPDADPGRPGARAPRARQRIPRRRFVAAPRHREDRRSLRRAGAGTAGIGRGHVPGTVDGRQDRPADDASRRGALGHRAGGDAGARDQEPAVGHSRRRPTAGDGGSRRGSRADAADHRRDRPHRLAGRPHGDLFRRAADRPLPGQHPCRARPCEGDRQRTVLPAGSRSWRITIHRCRRSTPTATS